ncbi:MAG: NAD(P)/FAD-dependent oxidoreductase [Frankiales bacterium]|nr:NAD(P)/FAD-dependent oxidoreductase [Frankiales bacterium]
MTGAARALVVGAGLGGLRAAEALRGAGFDGELVVLGEEDWAPYNRPPLSKEALAGELDHERLAFRVRREAADITWRHGVRAVAADLDGRTVVLADGERLGWDVLVAATGMRARRLEVPGPPPSAAAGRHVVRTLDDAIALRVALAPGARVVVLGAGFIGCEVAASARGLGCEVTCVALDEVPMQRPLGRVLGAELRRRHEMRGVAFRLGVTVAAFLGDDVVEGVELGDGTQVPADVVVEAVGTSANVEWLAGNGLDLADGVRTDAALRPLRDGAPLDGVAVVGDIARFPNTRFDDDAHRVEHWSLPTDSGRRAGEVLAAYLAGRSYDEVVAREWAPLPSFWSDQYDVHLQSFGYPGLADPDGAVLLEGDLGAECVVGYRRGDDLVGVVGLGMMRVLLGYRERLGRGRAGVSA